MAGFRYLIFEVLRMQLPTYEYRIRYEGIVGYLSVVAIAIAISR